MYYLVGLGNPGEKYQNTRHNVGWLMLDALSESALLPDSISSSKYSGRVSEGIFEGEEVTLLYPDTYMNNSGTAVAKLVPKNEADKLVVVYDDVDIPLGEIKISFGRGAGGHNGISSIINTLGTKDFVRIRVGVANRHFWTKEPVRPKGGKLNRHVLGKFTRKEDKTVGEVSQVVIKAISAIVNSGVEEAMRECN